VSGQAMYDVLMSYLERLPAALQEKELPPKEKVQQCVYSHHSRRATTAILLLDARSPSNRPRSPRSQALYDRTDYDKRRRSVRDYASHKVPS
jgi:hypothetical protein